LVKHQPSALVLVRARVVAPAAGARSLRRLQPPHRRHFSMRSYPHNSPEAAARIVALVLTSDGHVCSSEFDILEQLGANSAWSPNSCRTSFTRCAKNC
jgi:hypothetical protein